jgi:hypothetical protein
MPFSFILCNAAAEDSGPVTDRLQIEAILGCPFMNV